MYLLPVDLQSLTPFCAYPVKMPITVIRTAPDTSAYTSLAEFQAQTPESLEDPEVLHYSSPVDCVFIPPITSPFQSSSVVTYVTSK